MSISLSISRRVSTSKQPRLVPGTYDSVVVSVDYAQDYVEGEAFEIKYEVYAPDGTTLPYKEIFFNNEENPRSAEFFDYLESIGVSRDALETFEGFKEKLVIKRSTRGPFLTIESREFISAP